LLVRRLRRRRLALSLLLLTLDEASLLLLLLLDARTLTLSRPPLRSLALPGDLRSVEDRVPGQPRREGGVEQRRVDVPRGRPDRGPYRLGQRVLRLRAQYDLRLPRLGTSDDLGQLLYLLRLLRLSCGGMLLLLLGQALLLLKLLLLLLLLSLALLLLLLSLALLLLLLGQTLLLLELLLLLSQSGGPLLLSLLLPLNLLELLLPEGGRPLLLLDQCLRAGNSVRAAGGRPVGRPGTSRRRRLLAVGRSGGGWRRNPASPAQGIRDGPLLLLLLLVVALLLLLSPCGRGGGRSRGVA
jgi:hypothetical protein